MQTADLSRILDQLDTARRILDHADAAARKAMTPASIAKLRVAHDAIDSIARQLRDVRTNFEESTNTVH